MKRLAGVLVTVTLIACASKQPVPDSPGNTGATGTDQPTQQPQPPVELTGSVVYRERIALTPAAVLQVEVVEAGAQGGAETVVAQQSFQSQGQVPLSFSLSVPAERIRPEATYLLRASITDGARVFSTVQPMPVLTQGQPSRDVQVLVRMGG